MCNVKDRTTDSSDVSRVFYISLFIEKEKNYNEYNVMQREIFYKMSKNILLMLKLYVSESLSFIPLALNNCFDIFYHSYCSDDYLINNILVFKNDITSISTQLFIYMRIF